MIPIQLLKRAKAKFEREHGANHEESGYPEVLAWNKRVIFAHSKTEIKAYIKAQRLIPVIIYGVTFFIASISLCIFTHSNIIINKFIDIVFIALVSLLSVSCVCFCIFATKKLKQHIEIYKNKIVVYKLF